MCKQPFPLPFRDIPDSGEQNGGKCYATDRKAYLFSLWSAVQGRRWCLRWCLRFCMQNCFLRGENSKLKWAAPIIFFCTMQSHSASNPVHNRAQPKGWYLRRLHHLLSTKGFPTAWAFATESVVCEHISKERHMRLCSHLIDKSTNLPSLLHIL